MASFLGLTNFYSKYLPRYRDLIVSFSKLRQKSVQFNWTQRQTDAFETKNWLKKKKKKETDNFWSKERRNAMHWCEWTSHSSNHTTRSLSNMTIKKVNGSRIKLLEYWRGSTSQSVKREKDSKLLKTDIWNHLNTSLIIYRKCQGLQHREFSDEQ